MNPLMYIKVAALVGVIAGAIALKGLWDSNQELKAEKLILETQIETNDRNLKLLTKLLANEKETREAAQAAMSELAKDVPDVIYSQELPPSIQGVLDRFHSRIRTKP